MTITIVVVVVLKSIIFVSNIILSLFLVLLISYFLII